MTASSELHQYDIAVSFAGEDRDFVSDVARRLKASGVRVFYDRDEEIELWGQDLIEYFDAIYRLKSRFAVMFISQPYAEKMWPRHERRSALARGLEQSDPYVLPVRLDDTQLDGLRSTVGYLDGRLLGADGIAHAAVAKLGRTPVARVPRTELEREQLLRDRPPAWEYMLLAAQLIRARASAEDKYLDHEMQYAARKGIVVADDRIMSYLRDQAGEASALVGSLMRLMAPGVQERALGAPGVAGDADRICHLAERWNAVYVAWLDWSADLRGIQVPTKFARLVSLLARYMDKPIENYRTFVDGFFTDVDAAIPAVARGETVRMSSTLVVEIPDELSAEVDREFAQVTAD